VTTHCNCLLAKYGMSISLNLISMITNTNTYILSVNLFLQCLHTRTVSRHITVLHGYTFKYFTCYLLVPYLRSEVFTAVKIQVEVFSVVTPCIFVVGYQHFGGLCHLHLHSEDRGVTYSLVASIFTLNLESQIGILLPHFKASQPRRRRVQFQ
jgi:hypothetical protein